MKLFKPLSTLASAFFLCLVLKANNVQVSNVNHVLLTPNDSIVWLEFDLSWDNHFHLGSHWSAVWVFAKYRQGASGPWRHVDLGGGTPVVPAQGVADLPPDGKGAFVYQQSSAGSVSMSGIRLPWNFNQAGLASSDSVTFAVMGIEMVYIPQGSYWLGDGTGASGDLYAQFEDAATGNPLQVTSEAAMVLGGGAAGSLGNNDRSSQMAYPGCSGSGCLADSGDDFDDANSQTLPAAFPKGFNGFYCMRYEVTQQQMVDMYNLSTVSQQALLADSAHFFPNPAASHNHRFGIVHDGTAWITHEPYVPMVYCDWIRAAAYADWAGLRPMTELEFEKVCRGPGAALPGQFPWGNDQIDLAANLTVAMPGSPSEGLATGYNAGGNLGNCWINDGANHTMNALARTGIFAAHPLNTDRITSGAGYYGNMEMGGHAWERAVSVGHPEGRKFDGAHGDGELDPAGYANVATWPGTFASGRVETNVGVGYRGGGMSWPTSNTPSNAQISSRRLASGYWDVVIEDDGFRLVRTAP